MEKRSFESFELDLIGEDEILTVERARVDELKAEESGKKKIPPNCLHFKISDMMNIFLLSNISWPKSFSR